MHGSSNITAEELFAGPGETRALARSVDWSSTSLGPVAQWPLTLRDLVRTAMDSPFPVNLWCGEELVLIYNDAYRDVLGSKHPKAMGTAGPGVWAEIWGQVEPMFAQIRAGGPPVYAEDAPFVVERSADGPADPTTPNAWFTFALSGVRDEGGAIVAFLNIVSETTGRILAERAEARLLDIFDQAPAFMAVLRGPQHVFEYVNDAYYLLVGERELIGRPLIDALPEIRGQGFDQLLDRVLGTGEPFVGREIAVVLTREADEPAEERYVDFVYYPITEAEGTRSGVVAHGSDVTEHVRARKEALRARAEAEEANQAKSQFVATMSHEIRTPINAIIGYTDLLELGIAGPVTEKQRVQLERVRTSSAHLLTLIEDILDLAKVEAGRMSVRHERTPARQTIGDAIALVTPQAEARGITLENSCDEDVATVYFGDEDRVRQILVNLLSNAVKFTGDGGQVTIECGMVKPSDAGLVSDDEGLMTYMRVTDTGIGIAPAALAKVFEPFTQLDAGHTRRHGGTGLGLTISRHLARLMQGDLVAASEEGKGSTFTLWLPSVSSAPHHLAAVIRGEAQEIADPVLASAGEAIRQEMETIVERYVQRVRADPVMPAATMAEADLVDHVFAYLSDLAQTLIVLESDRAQVESLLEDGGEIQRVISDLHGRQRARFGWSAEALTREWTILREEIEARLVRAIGSEGAEGTARLLGRLLDRSEKVSVRSLRTALSVTGG